MNAEGLLDKWLADILGDVNSAFNTKQRHKRIVTINGAKQKLVEPTVDVTLTRTQETYPNVSPAAVIEQVIGGRGEGSLKLACNVGVETATAINLDNLVGRVFVERFSFGNKPAYDAQVVAFRDSVMDRAKFEAWIDSVPTELISAQIQEGRARKEELQRLQLEFLKELYLPKKLVQGLEECDPDIDGWWAIFDEVLDKELSKKLDDCLKPEFSAAKQRFLRARAQATIPVELPGEVQRELAHLFPDADTETFSNLAKCLTTIFFNIKKSLGQIKTSPNEGPSNLNATEILKGIDQTVPSPEWFGLTRVQRAISAARLSIKMLSSGLALWNKGMREDNLQDVVHGFNNIWNVWNGAKARSGAGLGVLCSMIPVDPAKRKRKPPAKPAAVEEKKEPRRRRRRGRPAAGGAPEDDAEEVEASASSRESLIAKEKVRREEAKASPCDEFSTEQTTAASAVTLFFMGIMDYLVSPSAPLVLRTELGMVRVPFVDPKDGEYKVLEGEGNDGRGFRIKHRGHPDLADVDFDGLPEPLRHRYREAYDLMLRQYKSVGFRVEERRTRAGFATLNFDDWGRAADLVTVNPIRVHEDIFFSKYFGSRRWTPNRLGLGIDEAQAFAAHTVRYNWNRRYADAFLASKKNGHMSEESDFPFPIADINCDEKGFPIGLYHEFTHTTAKYAHLRRRQLARTKLSSWAEQDFATLASNENSWFRPPADKLTNDDDSETDFAKVFDDIHRNWRASPTRVQLKDLAFAADVVANRPLLQVMPQTIEKQGIQPVDDRAPSAPLGTFSPPALFDWAADPEFGFDYPGVFFRFSEEAWQEQPSENISWRDGDWHKTDDADNTVVPDFLTENRRFMDASHVPPRVFPYPLTSLKGAVSRNATLLPGGKSADPSGVGPPYKQGQGDVFLVIPNRAKGYWNVSLAIMHFKGVQKVVGETRTIMREFRDNTISRDFSDQDFVSSASESEDEEEKAAAPPRPRRGRRPRSEDDQEEKKEPDRGASVERSEILRRQAELDAAAKALELEQTKVREREEAHRERVARHEAELKAREEELKAPREEQDDQEGTESEVKARKLQAEVRARQEAARRPRGKKAKPRQKSAPFRLGQLPLTDEEEEEFTGLSTRKRGGASPKPRKQRSSD